MDCKHDYINAAHLDVSYIIVESNLKIIPWKMRDPSRMLAGNLNESSAVDTVYIPWEKGLLMVALPTNGVIINCN